jgi:hypothetical protein
MRIVAFRMKIVERRATEKQNTRYLAKKSCFLTPKKSIFWHFFIIAAVL